MSRLTKLIESPWGIVGIALSPVLIGAALSLVAISNTTREEVSYSGIMQEEATVTSKGHSQESPRATVDVRLGGVIGSNGVGVPVGDNLVMGSHNGSDVYEVIFKSEKREFDEKGSNHVYGELWNNFAVGDKADVKYRIKSVKTTKGFFSPENLGTRQEYEFVSAKPIR